MKIWSVTDAFSLLARGQQMSLVYFLYQCFSNPIYYSSLNRNYTCITCTFCFFLYLGQYAIHHGSTVALDAPSAAEC